MLALIFFKELPTGGIEFGKHFNSKGPPAFDERI
jgi:hypothetical protein